MYPDPERLQVQLHSENLEEGDVVADALVFQDLLNSSLSTLSVQRLNGRRWTPLDSPDSQEAIDLVLNEGFEEHDATSAMLRCEGDPYRAIALLVAEEAEDRSDSESETTSVECCSQCRVTLSGISDSMDGELYCTTCLSAVEARFDIEAMALSLAISLADARESHAPSPHHQPLDHIRNGSAGSDGSSAVAQSSPAVEVKQPLATIPSAGFGTESLPNDEGPLAKGKVRWNRRIIAQDASSKDAFQLTSNNPGLLPVAGKSRTRWRQ